MITLVPLPESFHASLACLTQTHLSACRINALAIYNILTKPESDSWYSHPAVQMWSDARAGLLVYGYNACKEWQRRGLRDTLEENFATHLMQDYGEAHDAVIYPWWWGDDRVHASHRAALLAKDRMHYSALGWTETPELNYQWPTKLTG